MRRLIVLLPALSVAVACAEPDPRYGDPSGIIGKTLPNEAESSGTTGADAFGAAYSATAFAPTTTVKAAHAGDASRPQPSDNGSADCTTCHKTGGVADKKAFAFGGRVASKKAGVDVVVVTGSTQVGPVKSDADGYFWKLGTALSAASNVFVRSADKDGQMGSTITTGGCDSVGCHGAAQAPVASSLQ
jgi:hypothetical protein